MGMGQTLTPDRILATTAAVDGETLYRSEWHLRGSMVDATPWATSPVRAIRDGIEADRAYSHAIAA